MDENAQGTRIWCNLCGSAAIGGNLPKWGQVWFILGYEGIILVVKAQLYNQVFPILARCFSYFKPSPQPWSTF